MNIWRQVTSDSTGKINAKEELQSILEQLHKYGHQIVAADIHVEYDSFDQVTDSITLNMKHTEQELQAFYQRLNFKYSPGYGMQMIQGTVWLTYGVWLTRGEYDGSEWWEVHKQPTIPNHLRTQPQYEEQVKQ